MALNMSLHRGTEMTEPSQPAAPSALVPSRRQFLGGALVASAAAGAGAGPAFAAAPAFLHGVASGDPLADAVIIWTRASGVTHATNVEWLVANDAAMSQVVRRGSFVTTAARDYTVKADVRGLSAGTTYYYQFKVAGASSAIGRTKTLPTGNVSKVKLASFTCSDWEDGYFNAYNHALQFDDLDAVLHVGDYLYEYGRPPAYGRIEGGLDSPAIDYGYVPQVRIADLVPLGEMVQLSDYRTRHALYKTDPSLQELHRKNPWITIWDDHETANDTWTNGAENHHPDEGPFKARESAVIQAYYEWMPIRDSNLHIDAAQNPQGMYRSLDFGNLMRLIMLDTRLAGRDQQIFGTRLIGTYTGQVADTLDGTTNTRQRDIFGPAQRAWLESTLTSSTQTWQIFGNQILNFYQIVPDVNGSTVLSAQQKAQLIYLFGLLFGSAFVAQLLQLAPLGIPNPAFQDSWTGYKSAKIYFSTLLLTKARNPVLLTGDSHNMWTANLKLPVPGVGNVPVGVEFGGGSVTSGGLEQTLLGFPTDVYANLLVESSTNHSPTDKLIWTNQSQPGYLLVEITPAKTTCDHVMLSTVFSTTYTTTTKRFEVAAGTRTAVAV